MKNVNEMRERITQIFDDLRNGKIGHQQAAQFANMVGKVINGHKAQVMYHSMREEKPYISFLHSTDQDPKLKL